jgi:hypothetical protein
MPDDIPTPPAPVNVVNVGDAGNGFMGLTGVWRSVANFSAVVVVVGLACGIIVWNLQNDRADRREERQLFREALKDMNDEQNRRTGEVKGSTDKAVEVVRELITEIRTWKRLSGTRAPDADVPPPGGSP